MKFRIWDKRANSWEEHALININGEFAIWQHNELERHDRNTHDIMLCTEMNDAQRQKIFDKDIVSDNKGDHYIVEFNYLEFTLRDVTSENPKYDDDIEHNYNELHGQSLSTIFGYENLTIIGNVFENPELISDS